MKALEYTPLLPCPSSRPEHAPAPPAACSLHPAPHLLVWVHVNVALDALLPHVGPGVAAHPFSLALGTLVLAEAALFALVRGQTLAFGACLEDRKQTQGIGVHQATIMPPQVPTASPFRLHALCPQVQTRGHLLSQVQRTPVTPEHTWESQGWETHTAMKDRAGGGFLE